MKTPKKSIRIIKREQREVVEGDEKPSSELRREMIEKVSLWVSEKRLGQALQRRLDQALISTKPGDDYGNVVLPATIQCELN